jgi:hypothetical protein
LNFFQEYRASPRGACQISILLAATFSLILTPSAAGSVGTRLAEGSNQMSPLQSAQTGELSPNLIPSFSDPAASMIVVRVTGSEPAQSHQAGVETGLLMLVVIRVVHSEILHENDSMATRFERISDPQIRLRNQINAWNSLSLDPGELLLLSVKPEHPPRIYTALAAARISSPSDPNINAAIECYRIEAAVRENPASAQQMLLQALAGESDLSRFYALDLLTRRKELSREASSSVLTSALNSEIVPPKPRRDLGFQLVSGNLFDDKRGADSVNVGIISALAKQMVNSSDAKARGQWLRFLSSCVSREFSDDAKRDREMRSALVSAIRDPSPQQVISVLNASMREASGPDEAKPAKRLLDAWQSAFGLNR